MLVNWVSHNLAQHNLAKVPCLEVRDQLWWHLQNMVVHLPFPAGKITPEYCMNVDGNCILRTRWYILMKPIVLYIFLWLTELKAKKSIILLSVTCSSVANSPKYVLQLFILGHTRQHGLTLIPAWLSNYIHYKREMKLFIPSQTSMITPLKFGNE